MPEESAHQPDVLFDFPSLMVLGLMTVAGYYAGRLARWMRLPSILGYMLVGLATGPSVIQLLGHADLDGLSFITEIALGLVAFTIGSELSIKALRRQGKGLFPIIGAECIGTFLVVFAAIATLTYATEATINWPLALIFGAIASASAPAGTVAVIQEYKAKGSLTTALYAVVGFDDGLAILIFGFAFGISMTLLPGAADPGVASMIFAPASEIGLSLLLGTVTGFIFSFLVRKLANARDYIILVFGFVLFTCGFSTHLGDLLGLHLSLILINMVIGFVLVNTRQHELVHRVTDQLGGVMPLLFILFFAVAGAHLDLATLPSLGLIGLIYMAGRMVGKYGGARLGATWGGANEKIRRYLGWGLHTQAGVAIGLALIAADGLDHHAARLNAEGLAEAAASVTEIGSTIITTVTATCIFFEIIGPILAYMALNRAGEIPKEGQ